MASKLLTRKELEQLLKKNDMSMTFEKNQKNNHGSAFWLEFSLVYVNNVVQNFVLCDKCRSIITYKSSTGTGGLKKHLASCAKSLSSSTTTQSTITTYYTNKKSMIPRQIKKEVTDAYVEFVALDGRPFETASRIGFQQLLDTVFKAGKSTTKLQSIEISDVLPHATTVSRKIDQVYNFRQEQLIEWCKTLDSYAVVADMWTEKYSGIHFCGITLRAIDADFYLHSFLLGCKPYTLANQTAPNVRKFIDELLFDYSLSLNTNSYIVTDNEPKMLAALRNANRIGCSDHYINKVLEHSFTMTKSNCSEAIEVFEIVKTLVANFRRSHRQIKLSKKLQTFSPTRFSGAYYMLNIFDSAYHELVDVFSGSHAHNFESIDKDLLSELCQFLHLFDEVITILSEESLPTLHKVIPLKNLLLNHCELKPEDMPGIIKTKEFLRKDLMGEWMIQSEHLLATLVHPRLRDFSGNQSLKNQAIQLLQSIISSTTPSTNNSTTSNTSSSLSNDNLTTSRQPNLLSLCYDTPRDTQPTLDEITLWLQSDFDQDIIDDDLLSFWRKKKDQFPNIAGVARKVLAIPAANTSVERLFSSSKIVIGDRRTRLGAEKIDKLMFLQKNLIPLKHMFDSKKRLVPHLLKRKNDDQVDDDDDHCISKKNKVCQEYESDLSDDDYQSDKEN